MNFRFALKEISTCGDSGSYNATDLTVKIYVDNELLVTAAFLTTTVVFPYTTATGVIINSYAFEAGNIFKINIAFPNVWDSANVRVVATKVGFVEFDNTFKVFGYDLGNNSGLGITENPEVGIFLVPAGVAYAAFSHWVQPYTNTEYVYSTSSTEGVIQYQDPSDSSVLSNARNFIRCCDVSTSVIQHVDIYESNDCGCGGELVVIDTCDSGESTVTTYDLLPTFDFSVVCADCCVDQECITEIGTNQVVPELGVANIDQVYVDDVLVYSPDYTNILIEMYNYAGTLVTSASEEIDLTLPYVGLDHAMDFSIPIYGDYLFKVKVFINGVYQCVKSKIITSCHYYDIKKIGCRTFSLANYSQEAADVVVQKLNDDGVFVDFDTIAMTTCEAVEYTYSADGVYNMQYTNESLEVENLIVVVDCSIRECIVEHIHKLACHSKASCGCGGNCNSTCKGTPKDMYDFNAVMGLGYGFYSLLNMEYLDFYIYSVLEPTDLARFHSINQFINRVEEYCANCATTRSTSNCGCGK